MSWLGTYLILILTNPVAYFRVRNKQSTMVISKFQKLKNHQDTEIRQENKRKKNIFKRGVVYSRSTSYLDIRVGANLIWPYTFFTPRIETLQLWKPIRLSKPVWEEQRKCVTSCGSYYVKKGGQTIWTSQQMFLFSFPCTLQRDEMFLNMLLQP